MCEPVGPLLFASACDPRHRSAFDQKVPKLVCENETSATRRRQVVVKDDPAIDGDGLGMRPKVGRSDFDLVPFCGRLDVKAPQTVGNPGTERKLLDPGVRSDHPGTKSAACSGWQTAEPQRLDLEKELLAAA